MAVARMAMLLALLLPMHEGAPPLRVVQPSMPHGASRRKLACAALGIGASWCGSAAQAADSNVATSARETNLERMRAGAAEKERICEGRRGAIDYEVGMFDLTFDPPCYVSGIYELFVYVAGVAALKVAYEMTPEAPGSIAYDENRWYGALGVKSDATQAEIKDGYRAQARLWHPDKWSAASEEEQRAAEEKFKAVVEAYEVLSAGAPRQGAGS